VIKKWRSDYLLGDVFSLEPSTQLDRRECDKRDVNHFVIELPDNPLHLAEAPFVHGLSCWEINDGKHHLNK
jgi:hypothetical protein